MKPPAAPAWAPLGVRILAALTACKLLAELASFATTYLSSPADPGASGRAAMILGVAAVVHVAAIAALFARWRGTANLFFTLWIVAAIATKASPPGYLLAIPAWLFLVAPSTQDYLAQVERQTWPPLTWSARAKVLGAALLSGVLPGLGQAVQRRWLRALVIFVLWASAWIVHLEPVWVLLCLFAMSDAGWTTVDSFHRRDA